MIAAQPHQYHIEHTSRFRHTRQVERCISCVWLQPREDANQQLLSFKLELEPTAAIVAFTNFLGNTGHVCSNFKAHRELIVRSTSEVSTVGQPTVPSALAVDAWEELSNHATVVENWHFLAPSAYVYNCELLDRFCSQNNIVQTSDPLTSILEASSRINSLFNYAPGSTTVDSPIEEILGSCCGVCQDYSHVLLSIGRNWGIPSRYVSGYLHLEGASGEQTPSGESHAWTEFLLPDLGWVGIDPTNNSLADHRHVRVAAGRDYSDVPPIKGVIFGGGKATLDVQVIVKRESSTKSE